MNFHGSALLMVEKDGQPHVAMRNVVEGMKLAWQPQHRKLTDEAGRFCVTMMVMQVPGDDQAREVCVMPLRKLAGWLSTIQTSRIKDAEVRNRITVYQSECDDALWAYWTKGEAINPRVEPQGFRVPQSLSEALRMAADLEERRNELACQVQVLEPKARFYDRVASSDDAIPIGEFAKILGTGQNRMFEFLRVNGFLIRGSNLPYQDLVDRGLFKVIELAYTDVHGVDRFSSKVMITGKGQVHVEKVYRAKQAAGSLIPA
jgi:phage antirepressor YoqD-like protein